MPNRIPRSIWNCLNIFPSCKKFLGLLWHGNNLRETETELGTFCFFILVDSHQAVTSIWHPVRGGSASHLCEKVNGFRAALCFAVTWPWSESQGRKVPSVNSVRNIFLHIFLFLTFNGATSLCNTLAYVFWGILRRIYPGFCLGGFLSSHAIYGVK